VREFHQSKKNLKEGISSSKKNLEEEFSSSGVKSLVWIHQVIILLILD
jgi:hypothetical protein